MAALDLPLVARYTFQVYFPIIGEGWSIWTRFVCRARFWCSRKFPINHKHCSSEPLSNPSALYQQVMRIVLGLLKVAIHTNTRIP